MLEEDATFFVDRFSCNTFDWRGTIKTGFPIHSEKIFSDLREMKQSFVLVSQLPKGEGERVRRAISDIYDGDDDLSDIQIVNKHPSNDNNKKSQAQSVSLPVKDKDVSEMDYDNPCIDCGCEIPQARIDNVPGVVRCASCQSKFEAANPGSVARKVEERFGTRDDFKSMRGRQFGVNVQNKS